MRRRKIAIAVLVAVSVFFVCACAKMLSSNTQEVDAYIIGTDYHRAHNQVVSTGKSTTVIHHSAKYYTKIGYEDLSLIINDKDLYTKCKGHNGETIKCLLIIDKYDDGSIKRYLKRIENNP